MGFRSGAYAKCWSVEPKSDTMTKVRISISRKNKNTGEYEQDFSGFAAFVGSAAAKNAAKLKEGDRIRLGDVDVCTTYNKALGKEYVDYKVFSFEMADAPSAPTPGATRQTQPTPVDEMSEEMLPF